MTPEGKVKEKVKKLLVEFGVYWFCPVQTGFGARTLDFLGCHAGRFFAIETKRPGQKMTEQQCAIAERIERAGGRTFCISTSDIDAPEFVDLRSWLSSVLDGMMPTGFAGPSATKGGTPAKWGATLAGKLERK